MRNRAELAELQRCARVRPGAEPIAIGDGPDACLLCHGFTGTPTTMRFWAEHLAAAGYTCRVPRLPGHGTRWQEMNRVEWTDWLAVVEDAYRELAAAHRRVVVCGLSMGGALALRLAELHPEIAALVLVNPALYSADPTWRLLRPYSRLIPSRYAPGADVREPSLLGVSSDDLSYDVSPLPAAWQMWQLWREVRADLPRVRQPLLIFKSDEDHVVDPTSVELIRAGVRSTDVTVEPLHRSYHVATVDADAPAIFERSEAWIAGILGRDTAEEARP